MARREGGAGQRHLRLRIAQEAARLLAETGGDDFAWARGKAAARLGVRDEALMPDGGEMRDALREHRALFGGGDGGATDGARRRLEAAVEAMAFFADLEPRLVDATLSGDAGADVPLRVHLHADDPDAVARRVLERNIPARQSSRRIRLERDRRADMPAWTFEAGGVAFELVQLPLSALRQAPRDQLGDARLERSTLATLRRRLDGESTA